MTRIDPATAHQVHLILARCRQRGTDPVAALDAAGLLSYPARQELERQQLMRAVVETLRAMSPTMIGGGVVPSTAADMKRCIIDILERITE